MVTPVMSGQVCAALTRVIVPRNRHDQLVDALSSALSAIKVGDPFDQTTGMGPLGRSRARYRVESYLAKGRSEGAILAAGGGRPHHVNRGFYIDPHLLAQFGKRFTMERKDHATNT